VAAAETATRAFVDEILERAYEEHKDGTFLMNSPVGQRLTRYLRNNAAEKEKMQACKTKLELQEYKATWLSKAVEHITTRKTYQEDHKNHSIQDGEYMPFGMIVKSEGGWEDPDAVRGATTLAIKAVVMGPPWTMINDQTGRLTYWKITHKTREIFSKTWSTVEDSMQHTCMGMLWSMFPYLVWGG